jgi:hypothetical protein
MSGHFWFGLVVGAAVGYWVLPKVMSGKRTA